MSEDSLDKAIREAAREYNAPPETPREAIWEGVQQKRRLRPVGERRSWTRWAWIPAAAAALLAIGFGLGRVRTPAPETPAPAAETALRTDASGEPSRTGARPGTNAFRVAAANYLTRTETMLTRYRAAPPGAVPEDLGRWARELLTETRLLLDSPAAEDRELKELLWDLELLLAQITYATGNRESGENGAPRGSQFVNERLERRDILNRLRAWVPSGPFGT